MAESKIHRRGLTSFFTLFGFIIMSVTGLVLYVVPAGRVAYWTDWMLLGLSKTDWDNIHILSSLLFIVAGVFHTYFNWKPLMNYFKNKARRGVTLRRELVMSSVLSVIIIVGSIWPFPPLSYLLDFNAWIKTVWIIQDDYEPPFGHAELLSLKAFAQKMDIDLPPAIAELKSQGIRFDSPEQTLEEIAAANGISPMNLYLMIKKFEPAPEEMQSRVYTPEQVDLEFSGTGIGNKSLVAICEQFGISNEQAARRLSAAGIGQQKDATLKVLAEDANTEPLELLKVLLVEGYVP